MQITAVCPKCDNRYQFDAALLGQKVRCTNAKCREIFEVRQAPSEEPPTRPAVRDRRAPTFDSDSGEHQPLQAGEGPREVDWSKLPPPPVRRREEAAEAARDVATAAPEPEVASADEALAFMGLAPAAAPPADDDYTLPADAGAAGTEPVYDVADEGAAEGGYEDLYRQYRQPRRRWMWFALLFMVLIFAAGTIGLFIFARGKTSSRERTTFEEAAQDLKGRRYANAERLFSDLVSKYSTSKDAGKYRFLRDFAKAMNAATDPAEPAPSRKKKFSDVLSEWDSSSDPNVEQWKEHQGEIRDAFVRIAESEVNDANKRADARDFEGARKGQQAAAETQALIRRYAPGGQAMPEDFTKAFAALREKIEEGERYDKFLVDSDAKLKDLSPAALAEFKRLATENGYISRKEVVERIDAAEAGLRKRIVYTSIETPGVGQVPSGGLTSLIIGPNVDRIPENPSVVFALARGVLYALVEDKGQILWWTRVGIDTASLPVRVPATGNIPALVLVPSADGLGMMAREVLTGKPRWFQRLPAPIRGRPLLVEGRIIAPLTDDKGTVVVIESRDGLLQGKIELGQRLAAGAALQSGTARVFIPAEGQNVFVLDANPPIMDGPQRLLALVSILATNHGLGSLRAEPVIVGGVDDLGQISGIGYMILAQSDGFSDMKLRSFELTTLPDRSVQAIPGIEVKLPGWTWFAPVCDQEKVAVVTDAGALAVLGINQKQNQDPTLFPMVMSQPKERVNVGRGQIVHSEEHGFWYLAGGELSFMRKGFHPKEGLKLAPGWKSSLKLGTPLHASQVSADRATLFVVTQTLSPPSWLATAVNAQTGAILWQRPLGLAVQGDPVKLGDLVFQIDQGAGVYAVDPKAPISDGQEWTLAGQVLAQSRLDIVGEPYFLPDAEGKMAFVIYATGDGRQLHAVVVVPGQKASSPMTTQLAAPLAGPPLLIDKSLVMALADGGLHRWKLDEKDVKRGPDWRAPRLGERAKAFLTLVGKDGVLVTDGQRGLTLYQWPAGGEHQLKQQLNVPEKIIAAPVVLPAKDGPPRVAVADAGGRLTLLEGEQLAASLNWTMKALRKGDEITAGPFLIDDKGQPRLVVVADRLTVVCLSPEDRRELWSYRVKGDGVQHRLRQVDGALILGDVSGRYEALNAATGQPLEAPYPPLSPLPAAPASAPIAFGPDRLFAPLTDGTVLLIPTQALVPKK